MTVPPGEFKAARLRNLPQGANVGVAVESSRNITVAFIDTADYIKLPKPQNPVMLGKVDRTLKFSVTIPTSGDYFVVLVNPDTQSPADVKVKVEAARGAADPVDRANLVLQLFERQMHKLFVFDSFPVGVESCGRPLAFYGVDGFTLCKEYVELIGAKVKDRKMAKNILSFSIFHELGLELMAQWDLVGPTMRQTADELAAVMMIMLDQEENMRDLGQYVAANPLVAESFKDKLIDDWHPISVKRAEKLLQWLDDPRIARSWQERLVPHMQTRLLQWLKAKPTDWSDTALVEKELATRTDKDLPLTDSTDNPASL